MTQTQPKLKSRTRFRVTKKQWHDLQEDRVKKAVDLDGALRNNVSLRQSNEKLEHHCRALEQEILTLREQLASESKFANECMCKADLAQQLLEEAIEKAGRMAGRYKTHRDCLHDKQTKTTD